MTARQTTFNILDGYKKGDKFTGYSLMTEVKKRTGELHYPGTILRYMRIYRETSGRRIVNVDKMKSIYEIF